MRVARVKGLGGRRRDAQSKFLVASLIASVLLVGGLAWQAIAAARSQYDTAQQLLADYAAVAADELMRRSTVEVGYYGVHALMTELKRRLHAGGTRALPGPEALASVDDEGLRRATGLAERCFLLSREGVVAWGGSPSLIRVIEELDAGVVSSDASFGVVHGTDSDGHPYRLVFATDDQIGTFGFALRLEALPEWIVRAMGRGALVPQALGGGAIGNDRLDVRVVDGAGGELFALGVLRDPHVERPFGPNYGGLFQGLSVRVGIDPALARELVVGGVSPMRVPALLALLVTTVALVVTAILQLRRERELLRLRTDFVSRVSHELRTPLAQIRLFAETLLLDRARSADERERCLLIVQREAVRLSHLVDNVLLLRRGRALALPDPPRPLAPLVRDVVEEFRPSVREGLDLREELDESCEASVHAGSLRQILLNLLDNAVKYGVQPITVRLTRVDGFARLSVEDCGAGVPDTEKERVWDEFFRLERDAKSAQAGTGIGLAVVRELVATHGGRCTIEDVETGGARLVVDLPASGGSGAER